MKEKQNLYENLCLAKEHFFDKCKLEFTEYVQEGESQEYEACKFKLNNLRILFRTPKITPTKVGQFVTIWKRNKQKITEPYEENDNFDYLIICSKATTRFGLFIFSKNLLVDKGIVTGNNKVGKRGIRVYPIWDTVNNKQAEKTQLWQTKYFVQIDKSNQVSLILMKQLFENI